MTSLSFDVKPASALLAAARPSWLDRWGTFAAGLTFADLPAPVVERAKLVLLDCVGVIVAGMQEPECRALAARLAETGGPGGPGADCPAIGAGRGFAAGSAAFLNGVAGTMLELDEGNQYARGHPAIHVVPALLAAGPRRKATGADLLTALALGYEIGSRIGIAAKLLVTTHPHGTWGTAGAALAVAHLNRADAAMMIETLNIASTLGLATSRRTMLEGGTVRNAYAGLSNQLGLTAWDLAASGFVGETDGVGSVFGGVIATDFRPELMVEELGTRWEIARNYFKRHAACRYTHGALDALGDIVARAGGRIDPAEVAAIEVDTYVWAAQLDGPEPKNMLAAKFSLPFALATFLANGAATPDAFRDGARQDAATRELARRVTVREDRGLTARLPGLRPARVRLTLADGRRFEAEALTNKGDTEDPYSPDEVRAKFADLAGPVWGASHAAAIADCVASIDRAADLSTLTRLLSAPAAAGGSV
ncbi:2-methylcitrate dehydratase (plasmid) [Azospirillum sp. TSH58]|uniref:MmgE/PrpD family protein n=1 Tax=Azospirillum sp. TSH58 TaxID=664962 RepID=UPI000D601884|nr:MmgE/PrpD family protein [Azospirillum sp. TSH58]AWJ86364.1 2-methylcitrate dehydratase [Azospirillum sp. TSH58]PWC70055.1 2-methylcitrate dehydratase [Azospirillum sp. TSH58]